MQIGIREALWAVVAVLLVPFIVNQVSSRLDFSWSLWAALAAILIALGLFVTSDWPRQRMWIHSGHQHRVLIIIISTVIMGALGGLAASFLTRPATTPSKADVPPEPSQPPELRASVKQELKEEPKPSAPSAKGIATKREPKSEDKEPASSAPVPPVTVNAPGGVVSYGQRGGITAKEVTINTNAPSRVLASEQRHRQTGNPEAPWATEFTITATGLIATGDLKLKCTGPVIRAGIERINPASLITGSNGPEPNDPTAVLYQLGPEMLSAGRRVSVAVFSKNPVEVISGSIGNNQILFQSSPEAPDTNPTSRAIP